MNSSYLSMGFCLLFLFLINPVFATPACETLPNYVDELYNYYEDVEIIRHGCYPSFSFRTPVSYSDFGLSYIVSTNAITHASTIEEYDLRIRDRIANLESCPYLERYLELATEEQIANLPITAFLDERSKECLDMSGTLETMENQKIIRDFLTSQDQFGDYDVCEWGLDCGGSSCALSYSGGKTYDKISFSATCDDTREYIGLTLKNGEVIEAYLQNSFSEVYRRIYPDDVIIRERNPSWERAQDAQLIFIAVILAIVLVIGLIIYKKKK